VCTFILSTVSINFNCKNFDIHDEQHQGSSVFRAENQKAEESELSVQ